ncbi:MAG TPA: anthranilate synthase component I [Dissulfurispiraceae bacterium]|nr:anthranilate synthase component I [Dissulfurispiraceae bacterium]
MLFPDFSEFKSLTRRGNLIPVYKEIPGDVETPVSAFIKLGKKPSFLLESVTGGEKWARYSFFGIDPAMTLNCSGRKVTFQKRRKTSHVETDDPLSVIKDILSRFTPVEVPGVPRFSGGFVGYIGYDVVKFFERVPDAGKPALDMPDIFMMLTDTILIFDNLRQTIKIVSNVHIDNKNIEKTYENAGKRIDKIAARLKAKGKRQKMDHALSPLSFSPSPFSSFDNFSSNFTKEGFMDAVIKAKEYIMSGDILQVVLSQRFETRAPIHPFNLYRALRVINPSPYMYYLDTGGVQLVGSSPEILVRLEGDRITLRPIAGTRKRGDTEDADRALEEDMKKDPKEIAEHIMLVDLGRNDVGRVAEIGSVKVTEVMKVERYSHVMHLVSNVEGRLRKGLDAFDVFKACFPAGTVSGAAKVRAMEIIEELEPTKRGPYAGSVGYISYSGNMDMCITIRTLIIKNDTIFVQAGAGLVADSVPENEYYETVNKAMAMMKTVDFFEKNQNQQKAKG